MHHPGLRARPAAGLRFWVIVDNDADIIVAQALVLAAPRLISALAVAQYITEDSTSAADSCTLFFMVRNVLGGVLQTCCTDPLTGFYRDGKCNTGPEDAGSHTVCVVVNDEFLRHQKSIGNDLITPRPEYGFPGLKAGDAWCVCAAPWRRSFEAGVMATVRLESTHERALDVIPLEMLIKSARVN